MSSIDHIQEKFLSEVEKITSLSSLDEVRTRYLGKKSPISELYRKIGRLSPEEKRIQGSQINELRNFIQKTIDER